MSWLRRNVAEIAADPVLRIYGGVLAALHLLTFLVWKVEYSLEGILARGQMPICWPFFESCGEFRVFDAAGVRAVLWIYLAFGVLAVALFCSKRLIAPAYAMLVAVNLLKAAIWAQDYRLRLNQHYMAFFLTLAFLFLPDKRRLLRFLLVAFYFWAGTLKLDGEWLSGAALYAKPLGVPQALVPAACAYVVALELVLVFGVLARRAWIFWGMLAQLLLFHVSSFPVVGFFYPLLMFGALSIFVLDRMASPSPGPASPRTTIAFLAAFSFLQILPWLFPGDTAVTGEGRLFALHMFDARIVCEAEATVHTRDGRTHRLPIAAKLSRRTRCDPIVHLAIGRSLCATLAEELAGFADLTLHLRSRRSTEANFRPVIAEERFCASELEYDLWRPNAWIRKGSGAGG